MHPVTGDRGHPLAAQCSAFVNDRAFPCVGAKAALVASLSVPVDGATGALRVEAPLSKAGDRILFEAEMDLVIGLTVCSALQSNNGSFKPIHWQVE